MTDQAQSLSNLHEGRGAWPNSVPAHSHPDHRDQSRPLGQLSDSHGCAPVEPPSELLSRLTLSSPPSGLPPPSLQPKFDDSPAPFSPFHWRQRFPVYQTPRPQPTAASMRRSTLRAPGDEPPRTINTALLIRTLPSQPPPSAPAARAPTQPSLRERRKIQKMANVKDRRVLDAYRAKRHELRAPLRGSHTIDGQGNQHLLPQSNFSAYSAHCLGEETEDEDEEEATRTMRAAKAQYRAGRGAVEAGQREEHEYEPTMLIVPEHEGVLSTLEPSRLGL